MSAADEPRREVALHLVERHPLLGHRVALAQGDGLVVEGVEIDGEAERRADLVLTTVTAADRTRVVELDLPVLARAGGSGFGATRSSPPPWGLGAWSRV